MSARQNASRSRAPASVGFSMNSRAGLNSKFGHGVRQHLAEQSGRLARLQLLLSAAQFLTVVVVFRPLQSAKKNAENAL